MLMLQIRSMRQDSVFRPDTPGYCASRLARTCRHFDIIFWNSIVHSDSFFVKPGSTCKPLNSPLSALPIDPGDDFFEDLEIDVSAANNDHNLPAPKLFALLDDTANA